MSESNPLLNAQRESSEARFDDRIRPARLDEYTGWLCASRWRCSSRPRGLAAAGALVCVERKVDGRLVSETKSRFNNDSGMRLGAVAARRAGRGNHQERVEIESCLDVPLNV